jgi:hypothetical protein
MIRVVEVNEPAIFDARVRSPGMAYLNSLPSVDEAKTGEHPYWRRILRQLHDSYGGICAYTSHWIPYDTGNDTVEHFVPKSVFPSLAYEWSNYRLVCGRLNGRKKDFQDVIDPFDIVPGMFILEFPSLFIVAGTGLSPSQQSMILSTIKRLKLNDSRTIDMRLQFIQDLLKDHVTVQYVEERAPFLASEMFRLALDKQKLKQLFA